MATIVQNAPALDQEIRELEQQLSEKRRQLQSTSKPRACDVDAIETTVADREKNAQRHRALRKGFFPYLGDYGFLIVLTAPFIYSTFFALLILDVSLTLYQWICFPVYGLDRVKRREFIVIDRHQLDYLNALEKLNCVFCGYANGLLAYSMEIASRTEAFWCPIKHAAMTRGQHPRMEDFAEYSDAASYRIKQQKNGVKAKSAACDILRCGACRK